MLPDDRLLQLTTHYYTLLALKTSLTHILQAFYSFRVTRARPNVTLSIERDDLLHFSEQYVTSNKLYLLRKNLSSRN